MRLTLGLLSATVIFTFTAGAEFVRGQTLPTSQPTLLELYMEDVKLGHGEDHEANEVAWAAAFARAKFPYPYLALESVTGRSQVWYATSFESHAAIGESMKLSRDNKELAAELAGLARRDADHVENVRIVHARARMDLSVGTFPDVATQRFWEISTFRLRPGYDDEFAAAAKAYGASASRNAPKASYRVYEVIAGLPGPTYFIFSSVGAFGDFDAMLSGGDGTMKGLTAQEREAMEKFVAGLISSETHRFRLNPKMSYVPADVRAKDPKFWTQE